MEDSLLHHCCAKAETLFSHPLYSDIAYHRFSIHRCDREKVIFESEEHEKIIMEENYNRLSGSIIEKINSWIPGKKYLYSLDASSVPSSASSSLSEGFPPTNEFTFDLNDKNHYALRAIRHGSTALDDGELKDFVSRSDATYTMHCIDHPHEQELHMLYIAPGPANNDSFLHDMLKSVLSQS
jgi:hypothetical protein